MGTAARGWKACLSCFYLFIFFFLMQTLFGISVAHKLFPSSCLVFKCMDGLWLGAGGGGEQDKVILSHSSFVPPSVPGLEWNWMHKKLIGTITFPKKMRMIRRIPRDVGLMGEVTPSSSIPWQIAALLFCSEQTSRHLLIMGCSAAEPKNQDPPVLGAVLTQSSEAVIGPKDLTVCM